MDKLIETMESLEASNGMDKEFGETFGDMINRFEKDIGQEKTEDMIFDILGSFGGGYVSNPTEVKKWFDIQKELLPKIEGMKISNHVFDDRAPGACLIGKFGDYRVEVGIEDAKSKKNIKYYNINLTSDKHDIDEEIVFHSGVVFTVKDIEKLVELSKTNNINSIINLINGKYYSEKGWVETPECALKSLRDRANLPRYTAQINIPHLI